MKAFGRLPVLLLVAITVLEKVQGAQCAESNSRKIAGTKKFKSNKGYKSLLRTLVRNDAGKMDKASLSSDKNAARRLMRNLFNNYNKNVRPVQSADDTVKVGFGIDIVEILALNEDNGHVSLHTWVKMNWRDEFLVWNPAQYDGIDEIHVPAKDVWLPDIVLYNSAANENPMNTDVNLVVSNDGDVTLVAPATYEITCRHEFRGNSWSCPFRFASWSYNGNQVDLVAYNGQADMGESEYLMSDYFMLLDHKGTRDVRTFDGSDVFYPEMKYLLKLRSKIGPSLMGKRR